MQYYMVSEQEMRMLLRAYNKAIALESGGVDNWEWYGASICDFIDEWVRENDLDPEEDWGLEDMVDMDIKEYPICTY